MSDEIPHTYATVADLEARWHTLTATEQLAAQALLEDAAVLIDSEAASRGVAVPEGPARVVSCSMVKRAMMSAASAGISQQSETVGSFSQSYTWSNPSGDLYLTRQERRMLGCGGQRGRNVAL